MKNVFPNCQYLLNAHIDYLLMTGLLMIFFLLFTPFRVSPSPFVVFAMYGALIVRGPNELTFD